jgi:hypothetical protein
MQSLHSRHPALPRATLAPTPARALGRIRLRSALRDALGLAILVMVAASLLALRLWLYLPATHLPS